MGGHPAPPHPFILQNCVFPLSYFEISRNMVACPTDGSFSICMTSAFIVMMVPFIMGALNEELLETSYNELEIYQA